MGSEQYPLRQSGIYRNLPNFDPSIKGLTAIIVGATGISGFNTLRCLLDSPERWNNIYALSRKPPTKEMWSLLTPDQQARVQHVPIDLSKSAEETATSFAKAAVGSVDHVFFYGCTYTQGLKVPRSVYETSANLPPFAFRYSPKRQVCHGSQHG